MTHNKELVLKNIPKTASGLRDALFDEINALRRGEDTLRRAKTIAQLAHRIIEAARISLEVSVNAGARIELATIDKNEVLRGMLEKGNRKANQKAP